MRIVVCVKHVPDPDGGAGLTADGRIDRSGAGALNALDEHAVEAALSLAGRHGGSVVALTMGPPPAGRALRRALQLGVGDAVLVSDPALAGSDVFATAAVLAAAVRAVAHDGPVDLVLAGAESSDARTSVLPVLLAAELGWPSATRGCELSVAGGTASVRRALGATSEVVRVTLPAVVSVTALANDPRLPDVRTLVAARTAPITVRDLADLGPAPDAVGAAAARTRVVGSTPHGPRPDRLLLHDDGLAGVRVARHLVEKGLV